MCHLHLQPSRQQRAARPWLGYHQQHGGLNLRHTVARHRASSRTRKASVAKQAEALLCRTLGILDNDEDITERTLDSFAARFRDQLPDDVLEAMRAFFRLDDPHINAAKDGLIGHGGAGALDHGDGKAQTTVA
uniref:Uncharacterized protein n=1 Tax=Triticum urartu TaxID=4572 RepID=A0A8R7JYE3_TRIUA